MLILKGNFITCSLVRLCCAAWLACMAAPLPAATASPPPAPERVAAEFYGWYLDTLSADQDPLSDRYERFTTYVSKALVNRLAGRLRSGPAVPAAAAASDYFLKVAGYRSAWLKAQARARLMDLSGRQAEVLVTLGEGSAARQVLGLGMVLENGSWKISQVVGADPENLESASQPPVI